MTSPRVPQHYHTEVRTVSGDGVLLPAKLDFVPGAGWPVVFHSVASHQFTGSEQVRVQIGPDPKYANEWAEELATAMCRANFATPEVYDMLDPTRAAERLRKAAYDPISGPIVAWCNAPRGGVVRQVLALQMQRFRAGAYVSAYVARGELIEFGFGKNRFVVERARLVGSHLITIPRDLPPGPCIPTTKVYLSPAATLCAHSPVHEPTNLPATSYDF